MSRGVERIDGRLSDTLLHESKLIIRKPAVPEIICTEHFLFVVDADGGIKFLGRADEVLKK